MARTEKQKAARRVYNAANAEKLLTQRRAWVEANREKARQTHLDWLAKNADKQKEYRKKRYEANRDKNLAYMRQWREKNADKKHADGRKWHQDNRERSIENAKRWKKENAEHVKQKKAEYRADPTKRAIEAKSGKIYQLTNAERLRESAREYAVKHRLERALHQRQRDALKVKSGGKITKQEVLDLWAKQGGKCVFYSVCGNSLTEGERRQWHVDHIDPIRPKDKSRAPGRHSIENAQLLCGTCNIRKRNSDPYAFAQQNGLLFCDIVAIPKDKPKKRP